MKSHYICLAIVIFLAGCMVTQADLDGTPPVSSVSIIGDVSQFQACMFRWFDHAGFPSQIRFDDYLVFVPGSAIDLVFMVSVNGSTATMKSKAPNLAKSLQVGAVEACAADVNAAVPPGYWNFF